MPPPPPTLLGGEPPLFFLNVNTFQYALHCESKIHNFPDAARHRNWLLALAFEAQLTLVYTSAVVEHSLPLLTAIPSNMTCGSVT